MGTQACLLDDVDVGHAAWLKQLVKYDFKTSALS